MSNSEGLNRRGFIRSTAAILAGVSPGPALSSFPESFSADMSYSEFRNRLAGPIQSQPTPFNARLELDVQAVKRIVERGVRYGVKVFALTAGNSQYHALSYEEVKQLTRVLVESVGDRGLAIGATGAWWTGQAVDYSRYAQSVGAHAVQVLMPARYANEDQVVKHFETIARSTRLPLVLHGNYSEPLVRRLIQIESIQAMKEDVSLEYYIDRIIEFGHRLEIFSGGAENRFLVGYPYGARSFFSTYTTFAPDISMRFWEAIRQQDLKKATEITVKYDYPFIKRFSHPFWHATLECFGVAERHMRPPEIAFTDDQMKEVRQFFEGQGLDPRKYSNRG